jgi:hypothetical protein
MDWRIPEKLKKGVSYARFSITLRSINGNVKEVGSLRPENGCYSALGGFLDRWRINRRDI